MDFGRPENIDNVDFTLPDDHADTDILLASLKKRGNPSQRDKKKKTRSVYVGCSKWGIKEWIGTIYPPKTKEEDFLHYYLEQFSSIELNATHYRMPSFSTVKKWKSEAEADFKFCPKFPQIISHGKRLKNCERETDYFLKVVRNFEGNLGACFLQLPQNFASKKLPELESYVKTLPKDSQFCVEFRHSDWFDGSDTSNRTFEILRDSGIGTVITDTGGRRDLVHMRLTTPTAFIRFVGNNLHPTDFKRVDDWAKRIKKWLDSGIGTVYFLIHMHDEKDSPELSQYTIQKLNKECGLKLKELVFYGKSANLSKNPTGRTFR
jgi:uncharacterized protein YecE (DUF72 family)